MAYRGTHEANYNAHHNHHRNSNDDGGYDLDIFLNKQNAEDYICAMYE